MKGTKATALAIAILLSVAEANIVKFKPSVNWKLDQNTNEYVSDEIIIPTWDPTQDASDKVSDEPKWNLGLTATVNSYVDSTLHLLVPFLASNGLDPMLLPEIVEGFEVRLLLITYSAWLKLTEGNMTGLVNVTRFEDQKVNYFAKNLRVRVHLQFNDLEFNYNYLVQVMNIGPTGKIIGSLDRFRIVADILIDFNNDEIHLQEFKINDVGRLRVRLRGNILFDWLLNPVISVFTRLFNGIIMFTVELIIRGVFQSAVTGINGAIRDVISAIEAFN
ncbi:uncharacterized protein LOC125061929 isoform X2 [Pieris napi]|uniref:uncharacterized protein LOC125061929 isoform X2 n=1 Tax=Pieris napi TaxID=78633 RepID=UPI001FBAC9D4|nr:uncharacterized protein LOC125061929 isoform X2 [Pieris napi]